MYPGPEDEPQGLFYLAVGLLVVVAVTVLLAVAGA